MVAIALAQCTVFTDPGRNFIHPQFAFRISSYQDLKSGMSARVLRCGGVLVISTDYDQEPPDTTGKAAYGVPVHIFGPAEIRALVADAAEAGLDLVGELTDEVLAHPERPCHWARVNLDYTFILLTFRRR